MRYSILSVFLSISLIHAMHETKDFELMKKIGYDWQVGYSWHEMDMSELMKKVGYGWHDYSDTGIHREVRFLNTLNDIAAKIQDTHLTPEEKNQNKMLQTAMSRLNLRVLSRIVLKK